MGNNRKMKLLGKRYITRVLFFDSFFSEVMIILCYFPMQKLAKIFPKSSSLVTSPVISPK